MSAKIVSVAFGDFRKRLPGPEELHKIPASVTIEDPRYIRLVDVERHLHDEPIEARPPSTTYRVCKFIRRNRGLVAAAASIIVALLAGVLGTTSGWIVARHKAEDANKALAALQKTNDELRVTKNNLERLVNKYRHELIENALLYAIGGDEEKAEAATGRAKEAGVSEKWLQILEAQLLLYTYGRTDEAIALLEQASHDSIAAQGMLAVANMFGGRLEGYERAMLELERRLPREIENLTPEDLLFAGQATVQVDPPRTAEMVEHAISKRKSALARMIHAEIQVHLALHFHDADAIKSGIRDVQAAGEFLGHDNPLLMHINMALQYTAMIRGYLSQSESETFIRETRRIADQLQGVPASRLELLRLFENLGDHDYADRIWTQTTDTSDFEMMDYADCLVSRKPPDEILDALNRLGTTPGPYTYTARARVMALLPERHDEARSLCRRLLREHKSYGIRCLAICAMLLLGDLDEAREESRRLLASSTVPYWGFDHAMKCIADPVNPEESLKRAGEYEVARAHVCFAIALDFLAEGNRDDARTYFQKCVDTQSYPTPAYWSAKAYLKFMDADQEWPKWLPAKMKNQSEG